MYMAVSSISVNVYTNSVVSTVTVYHFNEISLTNYRDLTLFPKSPDLACMNIKNEKRVILWQQWEMMYLHFSIGKQMTKAFWLPAFILRWTHFLTPWLCFMVTSDLWIVNESYFGGNEAQDFQGIISWFREVWSTSCIHAGDIYTQLSPLNSLENGRQ